MSVDFNSLNPYMNMEFLSAQNPADLLDQIKAIRTPIKIVQIVSHRNRLVAYIMGDIRKKRGRPPKIKD